MRRSIGPFVFLLFLVCCGPDKATKRDRSKGLSKDPAKVTAMVAKGREENLTIDVEGETEPSDSFSLKTTGPVDIQKVFVEEGQKVAVGDPLISFDQTELRLKLDVARAEVKEMEAALELGGEPKEERPKAGAEEEVEELRIAPEPPAGGEEDGEKMHALQEAKLERARAEVNLYENALQEDRVGSPIAGVVIKKRVSDGMQLDTSDALIEIARVDPIHFVFALPVEEVPLLKREGSVPVRFPALKNLELRGDILTVGAAAAKENGKVEVKLKLSNEEGALHAGLRGQVLISTTERKSLFVVPETALVKEGNRHYIFVLNEERVKKTPVELAGAIGTSAVGKGEARVKNGLKEGDQFVAKSPRSLKDNEVVEIK